MSEILRAAKAGNFLEVVRLVEASADVNAKDNEWNESVLCSASESGSYKMVKYLVEHDADVNCKDWDKWSVLHYAAGSGSYENGQIFS